MTIPLPQQLSGLHNCGFEFKHKAERFIKQCGLIGYALVYDGRYFRLTFDADMYENELAGDDQYMNRLNNECEAREIGYV